MRTGRVVLLCVWIAVVICATGCGGLPEKLEPLATARQSSRGLVWMFAGLGGVPNELETPYRALREAGLDSEVRAFVWDGLIPDVVRCLADYEGNRARAAEIAAEIESYHLQYPDAPVDLVGYSAGGGLAVWVAEALADGVQLRNVVLVNAALSPTYDLGVCLQKVDGRVFSFHSPHDLFMGGLHCVVFGTLDREYVPSAAMLGFDVERAVPDESLREKLVQIPWSEEMLEYGHPGFHFAIVQYRWNKHYVAPLLVGPDELRIMPPSSVAGLIPRE